MGVRYWGTAILAMLNMMLTAQERIVDKIIAKVGTEIILYSDWQEQVNFAASRRALFKEVDRCAILENILVQKFIIHQAKIDSVQVKEEEVDQQLNARMEQILQYMNNDYKRFEEYYGQTVSEVRNRFREDLKNQLLAEKMQNKIVGNVTVTPQETADFYNGLHKDSIPYFSAEVEIEEIVRVPVASEEQKQKARDKLSKVLMRIKNGEDFSKIAAMISDDPASASNGGELGWMKRGSLVPEFEAVAYNLEIDSVSNIVETEFGFHIIKLVGRRGNTINAKHILVKPVITEADMKKTMNELDSIRTIILRDSIPFEQAVRLYSDKKSESYNNGGQVLNPQKGTTYFETKDLEPEVFFAIDDLKVGEISKPIESVAQDATKYYRLIKLKSRTEPHKANLKQDYAKIQAAAKELKKNLKFNEWLEMKMPKAYIEIDPAVQAICPSVTNLLRTP